MRPNRIMVALAVCCLLAACGKNQQPAPVEHAAPGVKLNNAEPVVPTPPETDPPLAQALQPSSAIQVSREPPPPGASAADLQALREAFERQNEADKSALEGLQSKLAALEQRLAQSEAKLLPRPQPAASPAKPARKKAKQPKAPVVSAKPKVLAPPASAETAPMLPFAVGSVDTWNGEKQVMVRSGGQWRGLRPGDSQDGWRIEAADGQVVTLRSPQGKRWQIEARQGG